MSYAAAIDQLNAMVPELHIHLGQPRRKFSLDEIGVLLEALGNPHHRFPSVLIAGTNGKGSTAATLASILTASGLRTGLYTSPHLERPNERIRINDAEISDDDFARYFFRVRECAQQLTLQAPRAEHAPDANTDRSSSVGPPLAQLPSFFETLTAMAFLHFAAEPVDIAVLEVGMGGRLDATNIVDPLLSIVTDISLDHTEWLGSTIAAIAREKAGILRRNGTLITLPQHPEANQVLGEVAIELGVRAVSAVPYMPSARPQTHTSRLVEERDPAPDPAASLKGRGLSPYIDPSERAWASAPEKADPYFIEALGTAIEITSPLRGTHQHRNVALAIAAAVELAFHHGVPITPASLAAGIRNTAWPGRLERITTHSSDGSASIEWILDVAHNPAGAWALRAALRTLLDVSGAKTATLLFSCLRDKPVVEMAQILFPLFDRVIFAPIHSPRATPMADLLAAAGATGTPATAASSVAEAISLAIARAVPVSAQLAGTASLPTDHPANRLRSLEGTGFSPYIQSLPKSEEALAPEGNAAPRAVVVISGSVYLVGEARTLLLASSRQPAGVEP